MILVSACLLGVKVKYNGESNFNELLHKYEPYGHFLPCCPEVMGGLSVPRLPAEIKGGTGAEVSEGKAAVVNCDGENISAMFLSGARKALSLARENKVSAAILKENSPSCGSHSIYDGSFSKTKITGQGVTAALLRRNGIKVYSEKELSESLLDNLIEADD